MINFYQFYEGVNFMRIANYNSKHDPVWHLLDKWQKQVEQRPVARQTVAKAKAWQPAADIRELADQFVITLDIPGVAPEALDIQMEKGVLSIAGARQATAQQGYQRQERPSGEFLRRFSLPDVADITHISANVRHGVLTITIPRKLSTQSRTIQVK